MKLGCHRGVKIEKMEDNTPVDDIHGGGGGGGLN